MTRDCRLDKATFVQRLEEHEGERLQKSGGRGSQAEEGTAGAKVLGWEHGWWVHRGREAGVGWRSMNFDMSPENRELAHSAWALVATIHLWLLL